MPKLNQPIVAGDYIIFGCDDWLVFALEQPTGAIVQFETECDPAWCNLPDGIECEWTEAGTVAVAIAMALRGARPRLVAAEFILATIEDFGITPTRTETAIAVAELHARLPA